MSSANVQSGINNLLSFLNYHEKEVECEFINSALYFLAEAQKEEGKYVVYGQRLCKLKIDSKIRLRNNWCQNDGDCENCIMSKTYGDQSEAI